MEQSQAFELTPLMRKDIDVWVKKFPPEKKISAVISALTIVQKQEGWLSDAMMNAVAEYLDIPQTAVYEVATFYSLYNLKPTGKYRIDVCTNVSCMLCGCDTIVKHLQQRLGIGFGETTDDGRYTLKEVECLAACGGAPAMQLDGQYFEHLTPEKVDKILDALEAKHERA
jgi:NADH-quinone oxidoreductase subunit E